MYISTYKQYVLYRIILKFRYLVFCAPAQFWREVSLQIILSVDLLVSTAHPDLVLLLLILLFTKIPPPERFPPPLPGHDFCPLWAYFSTFSTQLKLDIIYKFILTSYSSSSEIEDCFLVI